MAVAVLALVVFRTSMAFFHRPPFPAGVAQPQADFSFVRLDASAVSAAMASLGDTVQSSGRFLAGNPGLLELDSEINAFPEPVLAKLEKPSVAPVVPAGGGVSALSIEEKEFSLVPGSGPLPRTEPSSPFLDVQICESLSKAGFRAPELENMLPSAGDGDGEAVFRVTFDPDGFERCKVMQLPGASPAAGFARKIRKTLERATAAGPQSGTVAVRWKSGKKINPEKQKE